MSDDTKPEGRPEDPIEQWFWLSDDDMKCARDALAAGNLMDVFVHCQQALEKRLKGMYARATGNIPPYTHALMPLAKLCGLEPSPAQEKLMVALSTLYTEVRYPLPLAPEDQSPKAAAEAQESTEEVVLWLDQHPTS